MKLYYNPLSPFSHKAIIALEEKGAKYELELVDLQDPAAREAYRKLNPLGKVPFLVDAARDWKVPESSIIIEYLDRHVAGGTQLIPSDPDQARQARFHDRIFDLYLLDPLLKIFFDARRAEGTHDTLGVEAAQKRVDSTYVLLDRVLEKKRFILGDNFSIGDVAGAAALGVGSQLRPFNAHPNVSAYFGKLIERQSVQKVLAMAQKAMAGSR